MLGQDDDQDQTTFSESVGGASRYGHGLTNSDSTGYQDDDGRTDAAIHPQAPLPPARGMSSSIQDLPSSTTLPSTIASDGPGSNHARLHADPQPILVPSTGNDAASSSSPIHMWTATMTVTLLAIGCALVILL
ncbi:hypothetical protein BC940DRAFT_314890 [Gongronella butleri]|nr:hypothetical protein BC940DRAFT_314890 [Gongronella butleri]